MLNLGTIFRRVLSLTLHPFYRRERRHYYPVNRRMALPQKWSGESAGNTQLKVVRLLCVLSISRIAVCSVWKQQCWLCVINKLCLVCSVWTHQCCVSLINCVQCEYSSADCVSSVNCCVRCVQCEHSSADCVPSINCLFSVNTAVLTVCLQ